MRGILLVLVLAGCGSPTAPERPHLEYKERPDSVAPAPVCDPLTCALRPVQP